MARSRRAFLAAVGASATLAGCTARAPTKEPQYRLSARVLQGADAPFEFDATVRRSVATHRYPLALRATYENTRYAESQRELTVGHSWTTFSSGQDPTIVLVCPRSREEQASPGCWTPEDGGIGGLLAQIDLSDLPPGTTLHADYDVWRAPGGENEDRCLQPGTYHVPMDLGLGVELELDIESA